MSSQFSVIKQASVADPDARAAKSPLADIPLASGMRRGSVDSGDGRDRRLDDILAE
jgi:hypothetical protein